MGGGVTDLTAILPRPTLRAASCTRRHGSGCAVCADACPRDALSVPATDDPLRLDAEACIGCGLCVPACPTGALAGVGPTAGELVDRVADARASFPADAVVVRCLPAQKVAAPPYPASAVVPCLASVDPEALAAAAAGVGHGALVLERAACEYCPVASVRRVARTLRTAAALAASVAPGVAVSDLLLTAGEDPSPAAAPGPRRSRRSLFQPPTPRREAATDTPRALLLQVAPDAPLPHVAVDASCTACAACSRVCPTGALGWTGSADHPDLEFDPRACVGCAECVRVCAEDAIHLEGRRPGPHGPVVVARVTRSRCARCRAILSPGESVTCSRCAARRGILDDVWSALG